MKKRIMWLDNDTLLIGLMADSLRSADYDVEVIKSVLEAEILINDNTRNPYDLIILDVMIPTLSKEEERVYPPYITDANTATGLAFFRRMKALLKELGTQVFVVTQRLDSSVRDSFVQEGLPIANFATKYLLRKPDNIIRCIQILLESHRDNKVDAAKDTCVPVVNYISIGQMENSSILQGSQRAKQEVAISTTSFTILSNFIYQIKQQLAKIELDEVDEEIAKTDINSIEGQLSSPRPNIGVIGEALSSLRKILEGASANVLASELIKKITEISGML